MNNRNWVDWFARCESIDDWPSSTAMKRQQQDGSPISAAAALAPFKTDEWLKLTPAERLARSWKLRDRIPDLKALHDSKLFPKP